MLQIADQTQSVRGSYSSPLVLAGLPAAVAALALQMPTLGTAAAALVGCAFLLAPARTAAIVVVAGLFACGSILIVVGAATRTAWMIATGAVAVLVGWRLLEAFFLRGIRHARAEERRPTQVQVAAAQPKSTPSIGRHRQFASDPGPAVQRVVIEPIRPPSRPVREAVLEQDTRFNIVKNHGCTIKVVAEGSRQGADALPGAESRRSELVVKQNIKEFLNIQDNENCEITLILGARNGHG